MRMKPQLVKTNALSKKSFMSAPYQTVVYKRKLYYELYTGIGFNGKENFSISIALPVPIAGARINSFRGEPIIMLIKNCFVKAVVVK